MQVAGDLDVDGGWLEVPPAGFEGSPGPGRVDRLSVAQRRSLMVRGSYAPNAERTLSLTANLFDEDRLGGSQLKTNSRRIWSFALTGRSGSAAAGRWQGSVFGSTQRFHNQNTFVARDRSRETVAETSVLPTDDAGGSLQWSRLVLGTAVLSLGGDARYISGGKEGDLYNFDGSFNLHRKIGGHQLVGGVFMQGIVTPTEWLRLEPSVRPDGWRNFSGERVIRGSEQTTFPGRTATSISPRLATRVQAAPAIGLRGTIYRSFRAPTIDELYNGFQFANFVFEPNDLLEPEHLFGGELGVDWTPVPRATLRVTGYANRLENLSQYVFINDTTFRLQNVGRTHAKGLEVELTARPADSLLVSTGWTRVDAKIVAASDPSALGQRAPFTPKATLDATVSYGFPVLGRVTGIVNYLGSIVEDDGRYQPLEAVWLAGFDVRQGFANYVELFVRAENLFNRRYVASVFGALPRLGMPRTITAGATVRAFGAR